MWCVLCGIHATVSRNNLFTIVISNDDVAFQSNSSLSGKVQLNETPGGSSQPAAPSSTATPPEDDVDIQLYKMDGKIARKRDDK